MPIQLQGINKEIYECIIALTYLLLKLVLNEKEESKGTIEIDNSKYKNIWS